MGRPPMSVGTFGKIEVYEVTPGRHRARARFRDYDGRIRAVSRYGPTGAAAERELRKALRDRTTPVTGNTVTRQTRVGVLADQWLAEEILASELSSNTKEKYDHGVRKWVAPRAQQLRVAEMDVPAVDRILASVAAMHGPGAAKTTKSVLSGMLQLAVRHGALPRNPVRDASRLVGGKRRRRVRALTDIEVDDLLLWLGYDDRAVRLDLVDLVAFMLGTGLRIGEAMAVRDDVLSIADEAGTLEVNATAVRVRGVGMVLQERTKSDAGWRVIALPPDLVRMVERRRRIVYPHNRLGLLFPTVYGHLRDPSNTPGDLRKAFDWCGYEWVTSHTCRRTVATKLDGAGLSARQVADHLGHANPSMTQDVYMGRNVVTAEAATILARHTAQAPQPSSSPN